MTYCVGLDLKDGIVLLSDTRTNAGIDHVSTFGKMHVFEVPGERVIALLTAGNLALSQAVVNLLKEGIESDGTAETLYTVPSMFRAAQLVGAAIRHVYHIDGPALREQNVSFDICRQFHRGDARHALPADRRAQIRQADSRSRRELRHRAL